MEGKGRWRALTATRWGWIPSSHVAKGTRYQPAEPPLQSYSALTRLFARVASPLLSHMVTGTAATLAPPALEKTPHA